MAKKIAIGYGDDLHRSQRSGAPVCASTKMFGYIAHILSYSSLSPDNKVLLSRTEQLTAAAPMNQQDALDEIDYSRLLDDIPPRPFPTYDELSHTDYLNQHVLPNTPFLLSAQATSSWRASKSSRRPPPSPAKNHNGPLDNGTKTVSAPDLTSLGKYATHIVPVANTFKQEYSEFERSERPLGEILDLWEQDDEEGRGLYVKDWHLMAELEREGGARSESVDEIYVVPECLRDDWLNPPYTCSRRASPDASTKDASASTSDFRFCYAGPRGTFTPLHRDVYASYSWSANVVGRKLWWLFPPTDESMGRIRKDGAGELVFDVRQLEDEGGGIKVLQEEGEIIWVPSGWHHQVVNLDFCISFNHNYFASPTLPSIYAAMAQAQERVEEAISDVREMIVHRLGADGPWEKEWVEVVQGLLERDSGWGWSGFWGTVRANLLNPPAPASLSPPKELRNTSIRRVIELYRERREWEVLDDVRAIVLEVESLLDAPS